MDIYRMQYVVNYFWIGTRMKGRLDVLFTYFKVYFKVIVINNFNCYY